MRVDCVVCGEPIPATKPINAKTCSAACQKAARRAYLRDYMRQDRAADPERHRTYYRAKEKRLRQDADRLDRKLERERLRSADPENRRRKKEAERRRKTEKRLDEFMAIANEMEKRR